MIKKSATFIYLFICFNFNNVNFAQTDLKISDNDLKPLIGNWYGSLTYLDYSTNEPYTMPADINIYQIENTNKFIFSNSYPDEPNANSSDTLIISEDGTMLNNEAIKSNLELENGNIEIITEYPGIDGNDNKKAVIRNTYIIGDNIFNIRKDVQFEGQNDWLNRHEFTFTKDDPRR